MISFPEKRILMQRFQPFAVLVLIVIAAPGLSQSIPTVEYQDHVHLSSAHRLGMDEGTATAVAANDRCVVGTTGGGLWILAGEEDEISVDPLFFPMGGSWGSVRLEGDLAFVSGWPSLTIVNLSDLSAPSVVGATPGLSAYKFDLDGDYAFMAGSSGMLVVDISDLQNPSNVATLPSATEVEDVAVADGYAYLAEREVGIRIVDISDPTAPVAVGLVPRSDWTWKLDMHQGSLYVGGNGEFVCYDIPAPGSLALRWTLPVDSSVRDMDLVAEMAYLGGVPVMMRAVRIAGPGSPVVENEYPLGSYNAVSIATRNDHAYLATYWDKFFALNNFLQPAVTPLDTSAVGLGNIEAVDDLVFGRTWTGLECYQVDAAGQMSLVGTYEYSSDYYPGELVIQETPTNRYMWADDDGYVRLFDITDPTAMFYVGVGMVGGNPSDLDLDGSYLAVLASPDLVRIYSVDDPLNPDLLGDWPGTITADFMEMQAFEIHLAGGTIYQVNWLSGEDFLSSTVALPGTATSLLVSGESALVSIDRSLVLIDISDVTAPFIVDELTFPGQIMEMDVREGWGYAALDDGTSVFSYDNYAGLMLVGACETGRYQNGISLGSGCAFVFDGFTLLTIPLQTSLPVNCNGNDVFDMLEIANGGPGNADFNNDGILDICQPGITGVETGDVPVQGTVLHDPYPNPFNPQTTIAFEIPEQRAVSLRVFDLSGRLVKELITTEEYTPGRHEVVWNGRDDAGRQVASGTYFYRLEAGSYSETKRMVLVK